MTCTDQQVGKLMKEIKKHPLHTAAVRAGMDPKTARKYLKEKTLPSENKKPRSASTKPGVFDQHWDEIEGFLQHSPGLESKTILTWLTNLYPDEYSMNQLRTLQRRIKKWRALHGPDREMYFSQVHHPGVQSQSDYTDMSKLSVTICGQPFKHLLFHFMLPYSGWEAANICFSESFDSLVHGYERALWLFGGVTKEHRTDNLSAATKKMGSSRQFTESWGKVMAHYDVEPTRNTPGKSHENGAVEKSHDLLKNDIDQQLMMRGSRDFGSEQDYNEFVQLVVGQRNKMRSERIAQEIDMCADLPATKWYHPKTTTARVSKESLITVNTVSYSVPSRLMHQQVIVKLYPDKLSVYYGNHLIETMPRREPGENGVNYRHIIHQLVKKPGAFDNYKYKESLFPRKEYRQAYDALRRYSSAGAKHYLQVLEYAAETNEAEVAVAIDLLLTSAIPPTVDQVKTLVNKPLQCAPEVKITQPLLTEYDQLLKNGGASHVMH